MASLRSPRVPPWEGGGALFEEAIYASPLPISCLDVGGNVLFWNAASERVFGWTEQEVLGRPLPLIPPEATETFRRDFGECLAGNADGKHVVSLLRKDGSRLEAIISSGPILDATGKLIGAIGIAHEVAEVPMAQWPMVLVERLAAIGQRFVELAHESANALQRSQACLEMLAQKIEDRPPALEMVRRIQDAQDDLAALYGQARQYAGQIVLRREWVKVEEPLVRAWEDLAAARRARDARLVFDVMAPGTSVCVDRRAIEQVFRNILENSLAACADPVRICVASRDVPWSGRSAMEVTIRDNGPGMGAEQLLRLFEPFYTTNPRGSGLGMAIARRIVEAHGGRIAVGSAVGQPTEIVVTLLREHQE